MIYTFFRHEVKTSETVTFLVAQHHCPLTSILFGEVCEQLAQSQFITVERLAAEISQSLQCEGFVK